MTDPADIERQVRLALQDFLTLAEKAGMRASVRLTWPRPKPGQKARRTQAVCL